MRIDGTLTIALVAAMAALGLASSAMAQAEPGTLPGISTGDISFRVDAASFAEAPGVNRLEVYLALPNDQLGFDEQEGDFRGKVSILLDLRDAKGEGVARRLDTVSLSAGTLQRARDRKVVQLVTQELSAPPGNYVLTVEIEDLLTVKKQLLAQIRGEHMKGLAEVAVTVPVVDSSPVALSDLEFGRLVPASIPSTQPGEEEGSIQGTELLPNPTRMYGLLLPELIAFVEVYPGSGGVPPDSAGGWLTVYRVNGADGRELFRQERKGLQNTTTWGKTVRLDISGLDAGEYTLAVDINDGAGRVLASRQGTFQVAWSPYSWGHEHEEILIEMEPVLTKHEADKLAAMSPGEADVFLESYWKERDPTPDTPENEVMQEHFRRIGFARRHYPSPQRPGGIEDRGRIYVKYGEPDDLEEGYDDSFYARPQDTNEARSQVTAAGAAGAAGDASTDRLLDMKTREGLQRALGTSKADGKRFEVWYYDSRGSQLTRDQSGVRRSPRMRFVFMDQNGTGDYILMYSSEPGDY